MVYFRHLKYRKGMAGIVGSGCFPYPYRRIGLIFLYFSKQIEFSAFTAFGRGIEKNYIHHPGAAPSSIMRIIFGNSSIFLSFSCFLSFAVTRPKGAFVTAKDLQDIMKEGFSDTAGKNFWNRKEKKNPTTKQSNKIFSTFLRLSYPKGGFPVPFLNEPTQKPTWHLPEGRFLPSVAKIAAKFFELLNIKSDSTLQNKGIFHPL